jgi:TetR/AcrR family transcriptional regulator, cholesterol catabolism regulator
MGMSAKPCDGGPTLFQQQMARIVVDAWMSNALCWLNRRATTGDINRRLWHLLAVLASRYGVQYPASNPSFPLI